MLAKLNPDYVREKVNNPKASKRLLMIDKKLNDTFRLKKNAELWLFSQIMRCAMLASTVAPNAEQVCTFASVILQKYGNRPISHIAIFFGYAQVGQHYYDEYEMSNYGTFDLSHLLNDLGNHMRIALLRSYNLQQKLARFKHEIAKWTEVVEGRIPIYEELVNRMPPEQRAREIAKKGLTEADLSDEVIRSIKQRHIDYAKQMLEGERREFEAWLRQ